MTTPPDPAATPTRPTVPITVVVPTVDRPDTLERCLTGLAGGTAAPAAVVVVDQGGLPGTSAVLTALAADGLPVRHVRAPLRGLSAARNVGLRHVMTPWVAFTDDDCVPSPEWLASVHRRCTADDAPDGVTGRVLPLDVEGGAAYTLSLRVSTEPVVHRGPTYPWRVGTGGNMALRTALLRDVGAYDERLGTGTPGQAGEDLEIVHRLLRSGAVVAFDPAVLVFHDRVGAERRLATRRSYGFGMGAFAGLWFRSDRWVLRALGRWSLERVLNAGRALRRRDRWRVREELWLLRGMCAGAWFGSRLGSPVERAVDGPVDGPADGPFGRGGDGVGVDAQQL